VGDAVSSLNANPADQGSWRARAALIWLTSSADRMFEGSDQIDNYLNLHIKMQLLTVTAGLDSPFGTGITAILPFLSLWHEQNFFEPRTDRGMGDLELRLRQDLTNLLPLPKGLHWGLTLGTVLPTGVYLPAATEQQTFLNGTGTGDAGSRELNIGRGVGWIIADSDLTWIARPELMVYGNLQGRQPLGEAVDGFGWGNEVRSSIGARYQILEKWLSAQFSVDFQHRGAATWRGNGLDQPALPFPNGGGNSFYVTPGLSGQPLSWLGWSLSYRQNVHDEVTGTQLVQNPALFASISGTFAFGRKDLPKPPVLAVVSNAVVGQPAQVPEIAALVQPGKFTIVDYWATWCAPCLALGPKLEEAAKNRSDLLIQRVDATEWGKEEWNKYLPGVQGLPVLDIFGKDGKLLERRTGEETDHFDRALPAPPMAPLPAAPTPT
jgi:thioredoxin 1